MTFDGGESGQLEIFLESETKFISTGSEGIGTGTCIFMYYVNYSAQSMAGSW